MSRLGALLSILLMFAAGSAMAQDAARVVDERSNVDVLIDVLQDDAARADLIARLQAGEGEAAPEEQDAGDESLVEEVFSGEILETEPRSFGRQIAEATQATVERIGLGAVTLVEGLSRSGEAFEGLSGLNLGLILSTIGDLLAAIVVTVGVFVFLRGAARPKYRSMGESAEGSGFLKRLALYFASAVLDLVIVLIAWAAGYAVATLFLGTMGRIEIQQTLYLNAFIVVEAIKVALRMVLSPTTPHLRLLPVSNPAAKRLTFWIAVVVSLVGYGQLLAVPIVNQQVSFAAGRALGVLIAVIVLMVAVGLVLRYRKDVALWLQGGVRRGDAGGWLMRRWHWPVLLYLLGMFVVVLASPPQMAVASITKSVQLLMIILAGIAVSHMLTRAMAAGVNLPQAWNERLPLLEQRLNRFVPNALLVLRTLITVLIVAVLLDAVGIFAFRDWLSSQVGLSVAGTIVSVAVILLVAFGLWVALNSYVDYRLNPEVGAVATARETTLLTLMRNAGTIALLIITAMFALAEIGINIAPLIASAGVLGLAIGFGAQKLVQDIITGLFIQFENAINVGDVVTAGSITGSVEKLTVRSVSIRDLQGIYHLIPFSSVDAVSNYTRDFSAYVVDMGVAYREDVPTVKAAMLDAFEELQAHEEQGEFIRGDLQWFGLDAFGDSAIVLKCRIITDPGKQWGVGRAYNEICKRVFDERGIEIPFPYRTLVWGEERDGSARPLDMRRVSGPKDAPSENAPAVPRSGGTPTQDEPLEGDEADHS